MTTLFVAGELYRTRGGGKAKVYAVYDKGTLSIHGTVYDNEADEWKISAWYSNGLYVNGQERSNDLLPITIEDSESVYEHKTHIVDIGKVYRTRDSHQVQIYRVCKDSKRPVHGAILIDGGWESSSWTLDGLTRQGMLCSTDLIPVDKVVYVNMYYYPPADPKNSLSRMYHTGVFDTAEEAVKSFQEARHNISENVNKPKFVAVATRTVMSQYTNNIPAR